jgi:endonuclease/exonuclease/phosphatase family metal-dependent hydrolase
MQSLRSEIWLSLLSLSLGWPSAARADDKATDVRVMSFNIRYGTARDGENHWDRRQDLLVETVRTFAPDLLGTQETLAFQRDFLAEKLPEYDQLGVGRDDGREAGEMAALYHRRARFEKLDGGHFWLSESPDKAGSKSWDSALPRMVTWVKLRDRQDGADRPVVFFNTHFDHEGMTARLESARLLRRQIAKLAERCTVIVTGDFNADQGSPPYLVLFDRAGELPPLIDTYRAAHPRRAAEEGTFSGFRADALSGPRIDWIGVSRDWEIRSASIDRTSKDGRTPSDHFAVTAVLRPRPAQ